MRRKHRCDIADDLCASDHTEPAALAVNETMDDGCWRIKICRACAAVLGLEAEQEMPDNAKRLLQNARPQTR